MEFAVIDIETTGSAHLDGKITEIAIVVTDGKKIIETYETLVNPEMKIPYFISRLTGIDDKMVSTAPKFFEVAKEVIRLTKDRVFVAHNSNFDYGFMKHEFKMLGFDYNRKTICTVKTSRKVFPGLPSYSLGKIAKHFNIPIKARHRAMGDAEATAILFHKMVKENPEFLVDYKLDHKLAEELGVKKIPNVPGIYYFKNKAGEYIYIGKSKRLRSRVKSHLSNFKTKKGLSIIEEVQSIEFKKTGTEEMALLYENMEIKKHQPVYNQKQKNIAFPVGLFINKTTPYHTVYAAKLSKQDDIPIAGFKSLRDAKNRLLFWTEKYELCGKINKVDSTSKQSSCFPYRIKKCHGACINEEDPAVYNERVQQFEEAMGITKKNFVFTTDGVKKTEKGFVVVLNGIISAFGFVKKDTNFNNPQQLLLLSEPFEHDRDYQVILKLLLRNKKFERVEI